MDYDATSYSSLKFTTEISYRLHRREPCKQKPSSRIPSGSRAFVCLVQVRHYPNQKGTGPLQRRHMQRKRRRFADGAAGL